MIITILRKNLEGSVVENTLKHGCGAINIDESRIGNIVQDTSKNARSSERHKTTVYKSGLKEEFEGKITTGRWPANFILTHKDGCELKGNKKVKSNGHWTQKANIGKFYEGGWSSQEIDEGNKMSDEDGKETVSNWACVEGCPVKSLDAQTGILHSGKDVNPTTSEVSGFFGKTDNYYSSESNYGDSGGASRFFKQFKKEDNQ